MTLPAEDAYILRYRTALDDKLKTIARYRARDIVGADDIALVAVSGARLRDADLTTTRSR
jgi:hypothetical protein